MNKKLAAITVAAIATFASTPSATAADVTGSARGAFSKGRMHFFVTAGNGYAFDESYLVLGAGVSYYLIDGLNVGLSVETWTGSDPGLYKVTPSMTYVFHQIPQVSPYVGGFFRRTYIDGLPDLDSAGARGGSILLPDATPTSVSAWSTSPTSIATNPPTARAATPIPS